MSESYLYDMEEELERDKTNEKTNRLFNEMAITFIAEYELENKGKLLGHFASSKIILYIGVGVLGLLATVMFVLFWMVQFLFIIPCVIFMISMILWIIYYKKRINVYIDLYERAISGRAENTWNEGAHKFVHGISYFERAVVEKDILYLVGFNETQIYRFKNLKNAQQISYLINRRIAQSHRNKGDRD